MIIEDCNQKNNKKNKSKKDCVFKYIISIYILFIDEVIVILSKTQTSGIIHMVGGGLSVAALVLLVVFAAIHGTAWHVVSFSIFGSALIIMYTMSSLYHMFKEGTTVRKVFRIFDHCSIYLLIAATYTPVTLVPLRKAGQWGWWIFGIVWGLAVMGIVWKSIATGKARGISTAIYIAMGWLCVIAIVPMIRTIPLEGLLWLLAGGVFYTIGGMIYGLKKPKMTCKWF